MHGFNLLRLGHVFAGDASPLSSLATAAVNRAFVQTSARARFPSAMHPFGLRPLQYCTRLEEVVPNREVKPNRADGTAVKCGRVGRRLLKAETRVSAFFVAHSLTRTPWRRALRQQTGSVLKTGWYNKFRSSRQSRIRMVCQASCVSIRRRGICFVQ